jgi:hypothetical protein
MTAFGTIQVGRLTLTELPSQAAAPASAAPSSTAPTGRTLQILGQESTPAYAGLSLPLLQARQADILGLTGAFVPVVFTDKTDLNGYYTVVDSSVSQINWNAEMASVDWTIDLLRIGTDTEVDIESRLTGGTRVNSFSGTGVRWHAPAPAAYAYFSATGNSPGVVTRTGSDGATAVYYTLPTPCLPRWGCLVGSYLGARARFIDANNAERTGTQFLTTASGWTLHNALVRVSPLVIGTGMLSIDAWTGGAWQTKNWDLQYSGATLGQPLTVSVLRNEPEIVVLRLLWNTTAGRITGDLTLRRGSRFVEFYLQAQNSGTFKVVRGTAEAGSNGGSGEYVSATANDAAGNRYIVGSAKTTTQDLVNGGISLAATTIMDAFVGVIAGGSGAVAGDQGADLYGQYLGAPAELVQGVRR